MKFKAVFVFLTVFLTLNSFSLLYAEHSAPDAAPAAATSGISATGVTAAIDHSGHATGPVEVATGVIGTETEGGGDHDGHHAVAAPPIWMVIPFVIMLLLIAILPLVAEHWWHSNFNKGVVAVLLGLPMGIFYLIASPITLMHTMAEYVSFIVLLFALFTISGGIVVKGDIRATPLNNTIILAIGSLLASFIGTTGAAMLLIRPLLQTNSEREFTRHTIIFFILTVCNIGGCLTPLGDPPLFLGYLKGVPFTWTFGLWAPWLFMVASLLVLYYIIDIFMYKKETVQHVIDDNTMIEPISIRGRVNFVLVSGVVASAAFLGEPFREISMVALALTSMALTKKEYREANDFNFNAIIEVAVLFFGIFLTMIPALLLLQLRGGELGITEPWQFFWSTGILSSFLDNAPTYLTFLSLAEGYVTSAGLAVPAALAKVGVTHDILVAISLGAVFMGATTYIGNAPNFMVKVIAEENKIKMPSFFGYMLWSFGILLPFFFLVTYIFIV